MRTMLTTTALVALASTTGLAQAQQVVNVYNWSDYIAEETLEQFTAETGITVNYDVYDSNDTLEARMLGGSSGFDVVVPTGNYLQRQIAAGIYQPLNRELLPNWSNLDEHLMGLASSFDEGNEHAVVYMWGTTGIGYNTAAVAERLGEDYVVDSWSLVFDPEIASQLADCGIAFLDDHTEILPAALRYLGLDPLSTDEADLEQAVAMLDTIRPSLRYFHSSQYISDLANGEICVAVGWSGDVLQAAARAEEAGTGVEVAYVIPKEGANLWFDMMAIPADAPNPEAAHAFINFMMDAHVAAANTNYVAYPNAVAASNEFIDEEVLNDPTIYPPAETQANFWTLRPHDSRTDRLITRLWTRVRTGQ
ncbi:polyamine ABC transporter substrate-binding protein [Pararhodobacter sp. CCB-MM2]|uniref:polyamine ABC transporter substrate-binding protein n=1 Tax=Pararhodobacter sp. CCB-MM2 TaxID=1786003 RepID=UPI00083233EE|nr:polyamine ABC transporter substrate-binding protein [Pararhodobacter sp. CCB-MM2]MCA2011355.1 polyamine ABC transporter substrate-binding protein [Cereibacter sphaeroides]